MKKVIIMVGVPRSGKTTWVNRFTKSVGEDVCKVCSYDIIRQNLYGDKREQGDFKKVKKIFDYELSKALKDSKHEYIVVDNTNLKRKYRDDLLKFIEDIDNDILIMFKEIKVNKLLTIFRAIFTRFPLRVLSRMSKGYEELTPKEKSMTLV